MNATCNTYVKYIGQFGSYRKANLASKSRSGKTCQIRWKNVLNVDSIFG